MLETIKKLKEKLEKLSEKVNAYMNAKLFDVLDELVEEYETLLEEYYEISDDIIPEFPAYSNDYDKSYKVEEVMRKTKRYFDDTFKRLKGELEIYDAEDELDMMFPDRHEFPEDYDDMFEEE